MPTDPITTGVTPPQYSVSQGTTWSMPSLEEVASRIEDRAEAPSVIPQPIRTPDEITASLRSRQATHETLRDLKVKYDGCYGIFEGRTVIVRGFDTEDGIIKCYLIEKVGERERSTIITLDQINQINWSIPVLGAVNLRDSVLFMDRMHRQPSPARYRRGFRFDLCRIHEPSYNEFDRMSRDALQHSVNRINIVDGIYNRNLYTYSQALEQVLSLNRLGAAFSTDYYITLNYKGAVLLHRKRNVIGHYLKSRSEFKLTTSIFCDELTAFGVKWKV